MENDTNANRNSRWSVHPVTSDESRPFEWMTRDVRKQSQAIESLPEGAGAADFLEAIRLAIDALATTTEERKQVVVVSDFQKTMCEALDASQIASITKFEGSDPPVFADISSDRRCRSLDCLPYERIASCCSNDFVDRWSRSAMGG